MYIVYGLCRLVFFVLGTLRHGFSRPTTLVIHFRKDRQFKQWLADNPVSGAPQSKPHAIAGGEATPPEDSK
jgi:hypothetical protein